MDEAGNPTRIAPEVELEEGPDLSPEALAARLGPFAPPAGFTLGEEFDPPAPRPIPAILKRGSYRRRADRRSLTLLVFGALCSIYSSTRIVQELSYYLLPLGYLEWIGYGLSAL